MNLFSCIINNDLEGIKYCVKNGANINSKDEYGRTFLNYAIKYRSQEFIEFLVNNGANINAKDGLGSTPLDYAIHLKINQETIDYLISKGAKQGKDL